jgi:hypothetical protein
MLSGYILHRLECALIQLQVDVGCDIRGRGGGNYFKPLISTGHQIASAGSLRKVEHGGLLTVPACLCA